MLEAHTQVVSERSEQADIPLPEDERAGAAGLPLTVGDLLGKLAFWFPSELTKASLSLFTSTWQCTGITAGYVLQVRRLQKRDRLQVNKMMSRADVAG